MVIERIFPSFLMVFDFFWDICCESGVWGMATWFGAAPVSGTREALQAHARPLE